MISNPAVSHDPSTHPFSVTLIPPGVTRAADAISSYLAGKRQGTVMFLDCERETGVNGENPRMLKESMQKDPGIKPGTFLLKAAVLLNALLSSPHVIQA